MPDIIITDRRPRETYAVGATAQSVFTVPFPFFDTRDLKVYVGGTLKTLGTDYTATGAGTAGGTVTLTTAVSNVSVSIVRRIPIDRLTDFPAAGGFKVPMLNKELDRSTAIKQQIADDAARSLRPPDSEDMVGTLPALASRAARVLGFDASGNPVASTSTMTALDAVVAGGIAAGAVLVDCPPVISDGTLTSIDTGYQLSSAVQVALTVGGIEQRANYTVAGSVVTFPAVPAGVQAHVRILGVSPDAPAGGGAISYTPPPAIGSVSTGGSGPDAAANNHTHAHGTHTDPAAHAVASTTAAGFLSAADKVKLDGLGGAAAVTSVAGRDGAVVLAVADVAGAAPLASPALSGTPTAPTATPGTNTTQIANAAFVATALAALVNSSPATLDTLNELAAALGNDPNFATTVTTLLAGKAPLASPALTGTPTAPTASAATNTTQIATTAFVQIVAASLLSSTTPAALAASAAIGTGTTFARADHAHQRQLESVVIALGDETTAITTGTAKVTIRMPYAVTLTDVRASLATAGSSATIVNIKEAGATIFSTKLQIDSGSKTSVGSSAPRVISDSALADDAEITLDIDTAGTGAKGLKVALIGRQSA